MIFPEIGVEYPPRMIYDFCVGLELHDLARKIHPNLHILAPFKTDGCTAWPEEFFGKSISHCCILHDIKYWVGGSDDDRFISDCELAICVCKDVGYEIAHLMFEGVRIGGGPYWKKPYSWGYGIKNGI